MFIRHGQYETKFNETKALQYFNESMSWRKENNVYGNANSKILYSDLLKSLFFPYRYIKK
jgi:hypothetical protein